MKKILLLLLLIISATSYSKEFDVQVDSSNSVKDMITIVEKTIQVSDNIAPISEKEIKIKNCLEEYTKKQSKSYSKIIQNNLYDLIYNFNNILSKLYNGKIKNDISFEEKIAMLSKIQCEAYYDLGILK